jgi:hypothetical protein
MRMEIVEAVLHKIRAVSETEVTKTTLRMLGKDALRPDVRRRLCAAVKICLFLWEVAAGYHADTLGLLRPAL